MNKSSYEEVSKAYDNLMDLLWDCMSNITNNTDWANWHKKQAKQDTVNAYHELRTELFESHGWTHAEWDTENQRRVGLYFAGK